MGRLTERDKHEQGIWALVGGRYIFFEHNDHEYEVISKLAHYEDLEEAGRLIEQKHGQWENNQYGQTYCTNCGEYPEIAIKWNYCPNCGAKMLTKEEAERKLTELEGEQHE